MASTMNTFFIIFFILSFHGIILTIADSCPSNFISNFVSCLPAARDPNVVVDPNCCSAVATHIDNLSCLCSSFNSFKAKLLGIKLAYAIAIPKRCDIASRPIGYKCAGYTMP